TRRGSWTWISRWPAPAAASALRSARDYWRPCAGRCRSLWRSALWACPRRRSKLEEPHEPAPPQTPEAPRRDRDSLLRRHLRAPRLDPGLRTRQAAARGAGTADLARDPRARARAHL